MFPFPLLTEAKRAFGSYNFQCCSCSLYLSFILSFLTLYGHTVTIKKREKQTYVINLKNTRRVLFIKQKCKSRSILFFHHFLKSYQHNITPRV